MSDYQLSSATHFRLDLLERYCILLLRAAQSMITTEISKLAEVLEQDTLPYWVRAEISKRRDEIVRTFQAGGRVTLTGPKGERFVISAQLPNEKPKAAVA